ncbi:hydroxymethylglutaryl-CoA synthase, partial [Lactobacillus crispatus]
MQVGIDQIGLFTPDKYVDMVGLANARKQDPNKFLVGIGQREMSVADITQDAVSMGINATLKFIDKIDKNKVGLLIFGTESSIDQSKSASLFVKTALKLKPEVRTFEVKEACFGLTAALMMARDFVRVHPEQTAIVIGSDIARYGVNTAGEVTQGAGSVAMLIKADPSILALNNGHSAYSEDINDFWRPNYSRTALVDGKYSTQVYLDFFKKTFTDYKKQKG